MKSKRNTIKGNKTLPEREGALGSFDTTGGEATVSGSAGSVAAEPGQSTCVAESASCSTNCERSQQFLPGLEADFPPQPLPIELDISTRSLTTELLDQWDAEKTSNVGFCVNVYPNGEITGGSYKTGRKPPPKREGKAVSQEFTRQARKTIRRAVECGLVSFIIFLTVTFDPKKAQLDESGHVDQSWAKEKFKQFLNTLKKYFDRKAEKKNKGEAPFSYIWVAELQQNGNIHFHALVDRFIPILWLVKIWDQAPNSVNVKRLNDQHHAVNYILKYMKKGHCPIEGKRYGMTANLYEQIKPQKIRFEGVQRVEAFCKVKRDLYWEVKENGGDMIKTGFFIPAPKRPRKWRDKNGVTRETKGVSKLVSKKFMSKLDKSMKQLDFEMEVDVAVAAHYDDEVPF